MSDIQFEIGGLEELQADINRCFKEYPEKTSKKVYNFAGKFTKDVNEKFPATYRSGKRSLSKSWRREREKTMFTGYTIQVNVINTAPHFHLVENGHDMKVPESQAKKGSGKLKTIGFVPGKHYCEKTRNEWQNSFPDEVEKFVDKMLKDNRL